MSYECEACGKTFLDRLDHIEECYEVFPISAWNESEGPVLWWCYENGTLLGEPPYVGSPLDRPVSISIKINGMLEYAQSGWPGYHTHWTRIKIPPIIRPQ